MQTEQVHIEENTICFSYIGREWKILRADMEKLWEKMVHETITPNNAYGNNTLADNAHGNNAHDNNICDRDERLPYWAELWPSSLALAKWLESNQKDIEHKKCMDLGCGLGFTALCGASLGALVMGVDYEAYAIMLAKENAEANKFRVLNFSFFEDEKRALSSINAQQPEQKLEIEQELEIGHKLATGQINKTRDCLDFRVMDWRFPCISEHSLDFVWAADIVYEKTFVQPILDFLDYALKDTGKAWIAEPGRSIFEHFPVALKDTPFAMRCVSKQETAALSAHIPKAHVNIWEIVRKDVSVKV